MTLLLRILERIGLFRRSRWCAMRWTFNRKGSR